MTLTDSSEMDRSLAGISYPAAKDKLLERARANNAGTDILAVLRDIPDNEYASREAVSQAASGY